MMETLEEQECVSTKIRESEPIVIQATFICHISFFVFSFVSWVSLVRFLFCPHREEKILAEKAERQKEIDLRRKQRKAEELDTQPYISEPWELAESSGGVVWSFCKELMVFFFGWSEIVKYSSFW